MKTTFIATLMLTLLSISVNSAAYADNYYCIFNKGFKVTNKNYEPLYRLFTYDLKGPSYTVKVEIPAPYGSQLSHDLIIISMLDLALTSGKDVNLKARKTDNLGCEYYEKNYRNIKLSDIASIDVVK